MAIWVIDPEAVLKFRQKHRREVQRQRAAKRRQRAQQPRDLRPNEIDRDWMRSVDNDKS